MQSSYSKHNVNDYIGKKFGHLTVIGQSPKTHKFSNKFDLRCDCGNVISEIPSRVLDGHTTSCGKCNFKNSNTKLEEKVKSKIGERYGSLIVIGISKIPNDCQTYVKCRCDCGNFVDILPNHLFKENKGRKSCGCLKSKNKMLQSSKSTSAGNFKDGRAMHPLYGTWLQMLNRCENPNQKHYDRYGGRGIKVCEEWHDFWKFVEWSDSVGGKPDGYTIDRINNDGNYEPSNCRWANWETQTSNKSSNRFIEFNGKTQTIHQWSVELGIHHQTLTTRINRGWSIERALTEKPFIGNNQHKRK